MQLQKQVSILRKMSPSDSLWSQRYKTTFIPKYYFSGRYSSILTIYHGKTISMFSKVTLNWLVLLFVASGTITMEERNDAFSLLHITGTITKVTTRFLPWKPVGFYSTPQQRTTLSNNLCLSFSFSPSGVISVHPSVTSNLKPFFIFSCHFIWSICFSYHLCLHVWYQ